MNLPDGVMDPDLLDELELVNPRRAGRYRERPPLKKAASHLAAELMQQGRISNRDYRILETLYGATPILSRDQIQRLFWNHSDAPTLPRMVSNRLGTLVYPYYTLDYNPNAGIALRTAGLESCYVYYLGAVGMELLAAQRHRTGKPFRRPKTVYNALAAPIMLLHDLLVSEVYTRVRLRVAQEDDLRFRWVIQWQSVIRDQAGNELVRPDAILIFNHFDVTRYFFLEMDRDQGVRRWEEKIQKYENALSTGLWRGKVGMTTFPTVLVLTEKANPKRITEIVKKKLKATTWLFREWDDVLRGDILHNWKTQAGESVNLVDL